MSKLTDTQVRNIKADSKTRKYFDGGGLFFTSLQKVLSFGALTTGMKESTKLIL